MRAESYAVEMPFDANTKVDVATMSSSPTYLPCGMRGKSEDLWAMGDGQDPRVPAVHHTFAGAFEQDEGSFP